MKILSAFAALVLIAAALTGCADTDGELVIPSAPIAQVEEHLLETVELPDDISAEFHRIKKYSAAQLPGYNAVGLRIGYKSLNSDVERAVYDSLSTAVRSISKQKANNGLYYTEQVKVANIELSQASLRYIITAFTEDNPQIFWLSDVFGFSNTHGETVLQLYSFIDAFQINEKISEIDSVLTEIGQQLAQTSDQYTAERELHDILLKRCEYSDHISTVSDDPYAFTVYGALVRKRAVCEGYSRSLQWLLSLAGIQSTNIIGSAEGGLHMWNAVKLDGEWYYVDPTWDDSVRTARYDYFNVTADELSLSGHTPAPLFSKLTPDAVNGTNGREAQSFNLFIPECTATAQSYISRDGIVISSFDDYNEDLLVQKLYNSLKARNDLMYISIDFEDKTYDEVVSELTNSKNGRLFKYVREANYMFDGARIDPDNISMIKKSDKNLLVIILNYI